QFEVVGEVIAELVPPANAPAQTQQQAIDRLAERLGADLALFSVTNEPLAAAGRPLPPPTRNGRSGGWMRTGAGWLLAYRAGSAPARSRSRPSSAPSPSWSLSARVPSCDGSRDASSA